MQKKEEGARVYTVVDVMGGVAVGALSFGRLEDARAWLRRLRRGRDLERDDVRLFEGTIWWCSRQESDGRFAGGGPSQASRPDAV